MTPTTAILYIAGATALSAALYAATEYVRPKDRRRFAKWAGIGAAGGFLVGTAVVLLVTFGLPAWAFPAGMAAVAAALVTQFLYGRIIHMWSDSNDALRRRINHLERENRVLSNALEDSAETFRLISDLRNH